MRRSNKEKNKEIGRYMQDDKTSISQSNKPLKIPSYAWKVLAILSCIATMVMYA